MELKNKLKELRSSHGMTQEAVADRLGVSSQTVSKWERGLLCPDISLLPKIALLFKCSIDSLFDMDLLWSVEHRREFSQKIKSLHAKKDWDGVYQAWIQEIELNPDHYGNYPDVMLHVQRKQLYDEPRILKLISLADHAEKFCPDDDIRNEIYRIMLQICFESDHPAFKEKGQYYYKKLPLLRHSREVYIKYVTQGEDYRTQIRKNIMRLIDLAECSVRQLLLPDMPPEERIFYYQKAASLLETIVDDKYAGFFDPPLLHDYSSIAANYMRMGLTDEAYAYVGRIKTVLERHINGPWEGNQSKLLYATTLPNTVPPEQSCKKLLQDMLNAPEFEPFKQELAALQARYEAHFATKRNADE